MNFNNPELLKHSAIVVHCSATRPSMDIGVKEIRSWHVSPPRSWSDVGYHLIIRRDGSYEMGRPWGKQGAHTGGFNRNSDGKLTFGICMVGGVTETNVNIAEDNFTESQWKSLNVALYAIREYANISDFRGHNELPGYASRGCPSFDISAYRKWFNKAVNSLYLPDDWMTHDWKAGFDKDWNEVNVYKEINLDNGGAE